MTRAEHLDQAKQRALVYLERGELEYAFCSFVSDVRAHPETACEPLIDLGARLLFEGFLSTPAEMRAWIEGWR